MKKRLALLALGLCCGASLLGGFSGAIAWFHDQAIVPEQDSLIGASQGAYFARGSGRNGDPYIINRPIHLYNLAWLQYIGYFNDDNAPYYFALDREDDVTTLDMTGWVLPPIGTGLYPFIGNFNGNGETIANLTTDNVIGTDHIIKTPTLITLASYDANGVLKTYKKASESTPASFLDSTVDIVGFFGAVGEIDSMAPVTPSYASENIISSVALDGLKVSSGSSSTLIGLACGYDNATLSGVAVNGSELYAKDGATAKSYTTNLSDYSLVGYATETALDKCFVREDTTSLPKINNPNTQSGGQNWGGSIDMLHLYTQLAEIRDNHIGSSAIPATTPFKYTKKEVRVNGVKDDDLSLVVPDNRSSNSTYYRYEGNVLRYNDPEKDNPAYASFTFTRGFNNSSYNSYNDGESGNTHKYNCLYGEKTFSFTKTIYETTAETRTGFYIHAGDIYLTNDDGKPGYETSADSPTVWFWDGTRIYSQAATTTHYLRNNGGTLTLDTSRNNGSNWSYNNTYNTFTTGNTYGNTYYLRFSGEFWTLVNSTTESLGTYAISYVDGGRTYYLNAEIDNGTPRIAAPSTTLTEYGHWTYSNNMFSIKVNGDSYYLRYDDGLDLDTNTSQTFSLYGSNLRYRTGSWWDGYTNYYVRYTNQRWTAGSESGNRATAAEETRPIEFNISSTETTGKYVTQTSSSSSTSSYTTNPTYFPLLMEPETYKPMNQYIDPEDPGAQKKFNTGYIISGCNDTTSEAYQRLWGDIRISAYPFSSLSNPSTVRTRTRYLNGNDSVDSGWTSMTSDGDAARIKLQKYASSHAKLNELVQESQESGFVHGLHFMSAQISKSNLATIGRAVLLDGKTPQVLNDKGVYEDRASVYDSYQVPEDSIDFNLKSHGYINFFAGTYFTGNNCFFSLHQITRDDSNGIDTINEISQVYCPDYTDKDGNYLLGDEEHPYIYKYTGSPTKWSLYTWDAESKTWDCTTTTSEPAHGPLLFDCAWITAPESLSNAGVYYFEVPVNSGEYALGSVAGGNGAYLMYLDIGAGAANYKDVEQDETILTTISEIVFPKGIDFVDLSTKPASLVVAAPGGKSATVEIKPSNKPIKTSFAYTTNTKTHESVLAMANAGNDPPPSSTFDVSYEHELVSATYLTQPLSPSYSPTYSILAEKKITQNYNPNIGTGTLKFTYLEKYTITNGKSGRKIQLPNVGGNAAEWSVTSGSVTCSNAGLVTFTGTGQAIVQSTWSNSTEIGEATNWNPLSSNNAEGIETSPIVEFHFIDYSDASATPPNVVVTYEYSGTKDPSTKRQSFVYNINVDNRSGEDVILIIDALKLTYTTEGETTYSVTITYGGIPHDVTAVNQRFVIPAVS